MAAASFSVICGLDSICSAMATTRFKIFVPFLESHSNGNITEDRLPSSGSRRVSLTRPEL